MSGTVEPVDQREVTRIALSDPRCRAYTDAVRRMVVESQSDRDRLHYRLKLVRQCDARELRPGVGSDASGM